MSIPARAKLGHDDTPKQLSMLQTKSHSVLGSSSIRTTAGRSIDRWEEGHATPNMQYAENNMAFI